MVDSRKPASMLERTLREKREKRDILLMTHIVLGYPDFETSLALVDTMVAAGVDLMELQIPFSEPIADGPVILHANQEGLARGATVDRCFEVAAEVTRRHAIPFLFMTYYNVVYRRGVTRFVERMQKDGLQGAIVPDLPPEEAGDYLSSMHAARLDPIFIYAPTTSPERMRLLSDAGGGFVYCVARKGVTGSATSFSGGLSAYLARARAATSLPLAVGFGVTNKHDVDFLKGKADVAVVGSETLRVLASDGVDAVGEFIAALR